MHTVECRDSFDNCERRLTEAITRLGMSIFSMVDHGRNAQDVGLQLGRTKLFIFGNPSVGTLLMQRRREVGYDLPLRILLWEDQGRVFLTYKLPSEIAREYGLEDLDVIKKMDSVFTNLVSQVTGA